MPIQYALFENHVTSDPNDYRAIVQNSGSWNLDTVVKKIVLRGTTVNEADVLGVLVNALSVCAEGVIENNHINLAGIFELFPRVKGVFNGPVDPWEDNRHYIDVGCNPGSALREQVRQEATVQRVNATKPAPELIQYHDFGSDTNNDTVTVGNAGNLVGSRLKFDASKADEGLYFVATAGGETKVGTVMYNKPGRLDFLIPATLVPGTYWLEVRARQGDPPAGPDNRELRVGRLDATLTV